LSVLTDLSRLERIDWDFPQAGTPAGSIHTLHWFPGNFIPQIPAALIQVLSEPGDVVLDPFAGSGTTAVEALRLGRQAISSDRISPCILIGQAKLALAKKGFDKRRRNEIISELTFEHECKTNCLGANNEGGNPELLRWYTPDTLAQLRYLWSFIEAESGTRRCVLNAIFSDILFDCASTKGGNTSTGKIRRHHWGWVADNVRPKKLVEHNAIGLFRNRLAALEIEELPGAGGATILQQDARQMALPDESVNLVVTSPPYLGMIDYTHANRLLYMWMGWSIAAERNDEIGARFTRKRNSAEEDYLDAMEQSCVEMSRVMKHEGFCALVLGASRKYPDSVPRTFSIFESRMTRVWGPIARRPSRRRVSDRSAAEPTEYVCVFQKP
jgi:hypothetical protein